jgi:predicted aspartyl protease
VIDGQTTSTYRTTNSVLRPSPASKKIEKNADPNLSKFRHLIENFNIGKFYELTANEGEGDNFEVTDNISYTLYIAESLRHECPKLQIKIAGEEIKALIDTGCEMSILNQNLYSKLRQAGLQCLELPTQHVNLVSAFNDKNKIVKKQALLEVNIGGSKLDQVVLFSAQLLTKAILGLDFVINYEAEISFPERRITLRVNEEVFNFEFTGAKETSANRFCDLGLMSIHSRTQHPPIAVNKSHCYTKNFATGGADKSVQNRKKETGTCMEDREYLLDDDEECECM